MSGREKETEEVVANCQSGRLTVLSGEPGLGATFVLENGVRPALQAAQYIPVQFRFWQGRQILVNLKEAVASEVRAQTGISFYAQVETLDELLRRVRRLCRQTVVLLLDQFEDYLRCHVGTDFSDSADAELAHALSGREGGAVVALHAHALEAFGRFAQYVPNLLGFHVVLRPFTPEAARAAVVAEAARRGMSVEPAALEALWSARAAAMPDGGVHPYFVMLGCERACDAEVGARSLVVRSATLVLHDGVDRLILGSLDTKIGEFTATHRELLFRWCNLLISPTGQRRSVTEKALCEYAGKLNRFALTLLPVLMDARLVRSVEIGETLRYEIERDTLVPVLRNWWERREAAIIARRRARFRVRSLSIAAGTMAIVYIGWLMATWK